MSPKPIITDDTNLVSKLGLKFLYTNVDQFVNKREDLVMFIANDHPDIMLITEIIPKNQVNPSSIGYRRLQIFFEL